MAELFSQIGPTGQGLIFLISQPRSGSTLLQRMLASHLDIYSVSEPWVALHPIYALKEKGFRAEYNECLARRAVQGFYNTLPEGEDDYIEGIRRLLTHLYSRALEGHEKGYFLDKTPRYYYIIPELYRLFPDAKFVFLFRNPLAVLGSIISTWVKSDILSLYRFRDDLLLAPSYMMDGVELLGDKGKVVHYESLISRPDEELKKLCEYLDLSPDSEMVNYGKKEMPQWEFGDPENVYKKRSPDLSVADKWLNQIDSPQIKRLFSDYLERLGSDRLASMGYSSIDLMADIQSKSKHSLVTWVYSLEFLLKRHDDRSLGGRLLMRFVRTIETIRQR